jgi:hypothetical protein
MHYLKISLFVFVLSLSSFSKPHEEKLVWLGWDEGYEKAVKTKKILLVDAYTDWCGWCKRMDIDTYTNPDVIKKINEFFIPVKFNPEIKKMYKLDDQVLSPQQLYAQLTRGESTGYPTIYYIFTNKKSVFIDAGYKSPEDLLKILDMAIAESKK